MLYFDEIIASEDSSGLVNKCIIKKILVSFDDDRLLKVYEVLEESCYFIAVFSLEKTRLSHPNFDLYHE